MKIINEIEKSRLNKIVGGAGVGENCNAEVTYRSCGSSNGLNFEVTVCATKLSCPSSYACCSGSNPDQYTICKTTTMYVVKY